MKKDDQLVTEKQIEEYMSPPSPVLLIGFDGPTVESAARISRMEVELEFLEASAVPTS